jgi:hypothetical protein
MLIITPRDLLINILVVITIVLWISVKLSDWWSNRKYNATPLNDIVANTKISDKKDN